MEGEYEQEKIDKANGIEKPVRTEYEQQRHDAHQLLERQRMLLSQAEIPEWYRSLDTELLAELEEWRWPKEDEKDGLSKCRDYGMGTGRRRRNSSAVSPHSCACFGWICEHNAWDWRRRWCEAAIRCLSEVDILLGEGTGEV